MRLQQKPPHLRNIKRKFLKLGTCARTLAWILNREFEHPMEDEEKALDPMAGGILQNGYQCGMLWGSTMAVSAEASRRYENEDHATALAIMASQRMMQSFSDHTNYIDCYDVTKTDMHNKKSMAKWMVTGKFLSCFSLAKKWSPKAVDAAHKSLELNGELPNKCRSCASDVVKKMGGSKEEAVLVAGWAGGMGLSGNACGALSAAIWMHTLKLVRENPGKSFYKHPKAEETLETFYRATDFEILCKDITKRSFDTLDDHTAFLEEGKCKDLIEVLASS